MPEDITTALTVLLVNAAARYSDAVVEYVNAQQAYAVATQAAEDALTQLTEAGEARRSAEKALLALAGPADEAFA